MAAIDERGDLRREPGSRWNRLTATRGVLLAAALVLIAFIALGTLPLTYALAGFAVMVGAALIGGSAGRWPPQSPSGQRGPEPPLDDPPLAASQVR